MFGLRLHSRIQSLKRQAHRRLWAEKMARNGIHIGARFNVSGRPDWTDRIRFEGRAHFENDVQLWFSEEPSADPQLHIGPNAGLNRNTYIGVHDSIHIGADTMIGAYSYIISANHRFDSREIAIRLQGFSGAPVIIEDDVWLGTHVVVLPGVRIGKGAIVAAGSIVNRSIGDYQIWGGTPARFIKDRP